MINGCSEGLSDTQLQLLSGMACERWPLPLDEKLRTRVRKPAGVRAASSGRASDEPDGIVRGVPELGGVPELAK